MQRESRNTPFVTVEDRLWNGGSLIRLVFGAEFAVPTTEGRWHTSPWNAALLRRAKSMLGRSGEANPDALLGGLRVARTDADPETAPAAGPFAALVEEAASRHGVDPALVHAVVAVESAYRPRAVSSRGARGLMQLMPGTARLYGVRDPFDPRQNLEGGTRYLRDLLALFDLDLRLALAAFNAGEAAVVRAGRRIPAFRETRHYVAAILARLAGAASAGNRRLPFAR